MSEEINSSHLCTTEDAFEKFQSVSMYEEDEYITLSDIVPTQVQAPDIMDEICDIPYEDEVVLGSTNLVEQVCEVNSTIESVNDGSTASGPSGDHFITTCDVAEEVVVDEQNVNFEAGPNGIPESGLNDIATAEHKNVSDQIIRDKTQPQTSRRGRKKKHETTQPSTEGINNGITNDNTIAQQNSELVLNSSGKRRRGRPPKNLNNSSITEKTYLKEDCPKEILMQCSSVKTRGRQKSRSKVNSNQLLSEPTSSSDAVCKDVNKTNDTVVNPDSDNVVITSSGRRVKRKRLLSSENSAIDCNESIPILDPNVSDTVHKEQSKKGKRKKPTKTKINEINLNDQPSNQKTNNTDLESVNDENHDVNDEDDMDDICLSKLRSSLDPNEPLIPTESGSIDGEKEQIKVPEVNEFTMEIELAEENGQNNDHPIPQDEKKATVGEANNSEMIDFEDNIDKLVSLKEEQAELKHESATSEPDSLLVEDTSKRPTRRRIRKPLQYDEGSDEDPFANVELSDDEPIGCKKKYYSDDEYIPSKDKKGKQSDSSESDSDIETIEEELLENKRKRPYKKTDFSPTKGAKRGRKSVTSETAPGGITSDNTLPKAECRKDEDIEVCLKPSVIKTNDDQKNKDIESFLAKKIQGTDIKIQKKSITTVQPFEIPTIDPKEQKKMIENCSQTNKVTTKTAGVQTAAVYDIPMKENVVLTSDQSEKACEFLNSIVKTTAELGELMTQKSNDFMSKKINTDHVTDTFKMDYCVRKSFLLFKLAKHNLMQMEEDLAKQYDSFLETNNLQQYRQKPTVVTAVPKTEESDSDCEIIETPVDQKPKTKNQPKAFNPKTVFLNKELSIKIAKKTPIKDTKPAEKKIDIKGRHTVWINDSVMVKKVKPTQSFLAQDSRNKKPPDFVTLEMVNSFFKQYYRQKALTACAPYVSTDWLTQNSNVCCNFFAITEKIPESHETPSSSNQCVLVNGNTSETSDNLAEENIPLNPLTLFQLCTQVLQSHLNNRLEKTNAQSFATPKFEHNPQSLYKLCLNTINMSNLESEDVHYDNVNCASPTNSLCQEKCHKIDDYLSETDILDQDIDETECSSPLSLLDQEVSDKSNAVSPFILLEQEKYGNNALVPLSLKTLCYKHIMKHIFTKDQKTQPETIHQKVNWYEFSFNLDSFDGLNTFENEEIIKKPCHINGIKSLFSLCFDLVNIQINGKLVVDKRIECKSFAKEITQPKSLKCLTLNVIVRLMKMTRDISIKKKFVLPKKVKSLSGLCLEVITKLPFDKKQSPVHESLTINSINTLTEEAFHNIQHAEQTENLDFYEDDDSNFYEDEPESGVTNFEDDNGTAGDNWLSQVQMELRSCYTPNIPQEAETNFPETPNEVLETQPLIKTEPVEDFQENTDLLDNVKTEPLSHNLDEMTMIPENIVTKTEYEETSATSRAPIQRQNSDSYDVDRFEAFVATNKIMHGIHEYGNDDDEIFSQSALRVRRQFEPDDLSENDMGMSLLIPQTFEPLRIEHNAKDRLMESSSDESVNSKKISGKKKLEKRARGKPKKTEGKVTKVPVEKAPVTNEIAVLTRRMRDKIRQEEKKVVSSESDTETESLITKKSKQKAKTAKVLEDEKDVNIEVKTKKPADEEIQCSNVDSTEQINESRNVSPCVSNFTGFTAVDQNEISTLHKYVKYVYDQIIPKESEESNLQGQYNADPPVINPEDPVELLECEPSMPYFPEESPSKTRKPGPKTKTRNLKEIKAVLLQGENKEIKTALQKDDNKTKSIDTIDKKENFIDRHGWKCYPLDGNDTKLYQNAQIVLEKLPESFVQTYFMYQDIATKDNEDEEVDRLINLQSLNRPATKDGKNNRGKMSIKNPDKISELLMAGNKPGSISPTFSENADELTPSEDEGGRVEDELPPPVKQTSDNHLAKNSLMDDNESNDETSLSKIKKEASDEYDNPIKYRSKKSQAKSKALAEAAAGPVMLTADKMMNKELNLLHAPINLDNTVEPASSKGRTSKHKQRSANKTSPKEHVKAENDSSSEEEKHQWFTVKEKLLKRMVKKSDTTREDDAKRAKLVSEFIERRGDSSEAYIKRRGNAGRSRRVSKKKMLERQKQLKVLSRELFGDPSNDASLHRKSLASQAYFKGRRNIRKVIDKKSLARSTVIANMEEFERKRRINIRQSRLREIMQCEEGVNVLVINDEVCLEYDFDEHRPVVTIHPFFTKVMKAHQYEGVKFMWDACFESLESIAAGHPGGGCILAHCMGLGKTLQVLALLHTVLTHPRVGMQRVLVCCPLSTVLNWVDEIHKWIGPVTNQIKVFELSKLKKTSNRAYQLEDWYNGGGIFIIGYELFRSLTTLDPILDSVRPAVVNKIRNALLDPGPDIIICDEGHLLKNDCSVLAVAMSRVVTKRRIVLTGTPMQNNLREYYCMVNFVKPNLLGTYSEYSNRFENPIMNGQHRDSREEDIKLMKARTHILHKVLEGCLQRQEASVLYPYLPKKHEYTVFISLTECQWDLYKHYLQNYSNTQNNKSVLKDFHILQKIWSHPQVLHNFQSRTDTNRNKVKEEKLEDDLAREDLNASEDIKPTDTEVWWLDYLEDGAMLDSLASSNKFVTVFRILEESIALNDKVLIFSTSLFTMDALEYFLKKINNWSLGQEYFRLDGSVPAEVRQKWCREFNAENNVKTKLFLISTRAGCLGLNMTAANRVIILDTSWNPAHDIQSIFRVYRFGQKKDCYIYRLVALGTMEQKIYERSVTKQAVACRVVDEQQIDRHYNMAELTELYKYDETGAGVAGGVAVGVEDVVLLRVARDAALHAVHEHDSLLRGSLEQGLPEHERDAAWVQFQEEHAHKQQMQELPPTVKVKKVKVKVPTQPLPTPTPTTDYPLPGASWEPVKPEPEESILPNDPEFTPELKPKSKGKKRRPTKSSIVSCCIPIQPEAPETPQPPAVEGQNGDEDMIKRITHILLKYNYQNNQGPKEIAELVARVRNLVHSGKMDQLDSSDELTMNIARVLLGKNASKRLPPPPLTDIVQDITNNIAPPPTANKERKTDDKEKAPYKPGPRSRGRPKNNDLTDAKPRKGYVYEAVPSASHEPEPEPDDGRRKRRNAALAAEKNFEAPPVGEPVVDIEDDDVDFMPEAPAEFDEPDRDSDSSEGLVFSNIEIKKECDNLIASRLKKTATERSKDKHKKNEAQPTSELSQSDSILLSDDDDEPAVVPRRKPGPLRKTIKIERTESPANSKEVVPLHPSLLSNQNFIKIVAHTYLSGNPMLDEDAATLAAQYSTFKALKEYAADGKNVDIVSGPIYDIAMKVLGVDVLKKLNKSNVKISTSDLLAQHPINSKDGVPAKDTVLKQLDVDDKKTESAKQKSVPKPVEQAVQGVQTTEPSPQESFTGDLYSMLFNSKANMEQKSQPVSAPVKVESSGPKRKPVTIKIRLPSGSKKTVYPVQMTAMNATSNVVPVGLFKRAAEAPAQSSEIISADECILPDDDDIRIEPAPAQPPPAPAQPPPAPPPPRAHSTLAAHSVPGPLSVPQPQRDYGTIDITSDDEEPAAPPAPPAAPVPVSLSAAALPGQPRVLRQVFPIRRSDAAPGILHSHLSAVGQPPSQYILVPPGSNLTPVYPVALEKVQNRPPEPPQPAKRPEVIRFDKLEHPHPPQIAIDSGTVATAPVDPAKGSKRMCRPGDILRITKSGEIEVLNRKDLKDLPEEIPKETPKEAPTASRTPWQPPPPQVMRGCNKTPEPAKPATKAKPAPAKKAESAKPLTFTNIAPKPTAAPKEQKAPSTGASALKSSTSVSAPKSSTSVSAPKSSTSGSAPKSSTSVSAPKSSTSVSAPKSSTSVSAPKSSTSVSAPKSSTSVSAPKSSTGGSAPKSSTVTETVIVSRSPSPSDIFKNVVHIAADDYVSLVDDELPTPERNTVSIPLKTPAPSGSGPSKSTPGKWQNTITHTTKPTADKTVSSNTLLKPSTSTANTTALNPKPSTPTAKPSKSTAKPSTSTAKPSTSNAKTPGTGPPQKTSQTPAKANAANKYKDKVLDLVDLTDLDFVPASTKKAKPQTNTIVGTSKTIILCASGKAVSKPVATTKTPAKPAPKVDKVTPTPKAATPAPKADVKKRPAPVDNNAAKKKKTDKPMTLKDFDIDDIDDIIELD